MENISIVGGDARNIELAKIYAKYKKVYTFGLEQSEETYNTENVIKCKSLDEAMENSNLIVTAIPISKDKITINTPYSKENILIEEVLKKANNKMIITGKLPEKLIEKYSNRKIVDLLEREDFAILNALPTAEGTIKIIIENIYMNISNSNILIIGFGRIGKVLADRLKKLNANVYVSARKNEDFAWMHVLGYNPVKYKQLNEKLPKFDIIINTVPYLIIDGSKLELVKKNCLLIELASLPGGIDEKSTKLKELKLINAQGLPGKISKVAAAKIIEETIKNIIEEMKEK